MHDSGMGATTASERLDFIVSMTNLTWPAVAAIVSDFQTLTGVGMRSVQQLNQQFDQTKSSLLALGGVAGLTLFSATNAAMDFNREMAVVRGLLEDINENQFQQLSDNAKKISITFGMMPSEIAKGLQNVARAGVQDIDHQTKVLKAGLELAKIEGYNAADAVSHVISATALFGDTYDNVERYANALAHAANVSITSAPKLAEALRYVGGLAQMHYSVEETLAALASMAQKGVEGSVAGISLRSFLSYIIREMPKTKKALDELGLTFDDFWVKTEKGQRIRLKPIEDIILTIRQAALSKGINYEELPRVLSQIGEPRQVQQYIKLFPTDQELKTGKWSLHDFNIEMQKSYDLQGRLDKVLSSTGERWNQFTSSIQVLGINLGETILPVLGNLLDIGKRITDTFASSRFAISALSGALLTLAGSAAILAASWGKDAITEGISKSISLIKEKAKEVTGLASAAYNAVDELYSSKVEKRITQYEKEGLSGGLETKIYGETFGYSTTGNRFQHYILRYINENLKNQYENIDQRIPLSAREVWVRGSYMLENLDRPPQATAVLAGLANTLEVKKGKIIDRREELSNFLNRRLGELIGFGSADNLVGLDNSANIYNILSDRFDEDTLAYVNRAVRSILNHQDSPILKPIVESLQGKRKVPLNEISIYDSTNERPSILSIPEIDEKQQRLHYKNPIVEMFKNIQREMKSIRQPDEYLINPKEEIVEGLIKRFNEDIINYFEVLRGEGKTDSYYRRLSNLVGTIYALSSGEQFSPRTTEYLSKFENIDEEKILTKARIFPQMISYETINFFDTIEREMTIYTKELMKDSYIQGSLNNLEAFGTRIKKFGKDFSKTINQDMTLSFEKYLEYYKETYLKTKRELKNILINALNINEIAKAEVIAELTDQGYEYDELQSEYGTLYEKRVEEATQYYLDSFGIDEHVENILQEASAKAILPGTTLTPRSGERKLEKGPLKTRAYNIKAHEFAKFLKKQIDSTFVEYLKTKEGLPSQLEEALSFYREDTEEFENLVNQIVSYWSHPAVLETLVELNDINKESVRSVINTIKTGILPETFSKLIDSAPSEIEEIGTGILIGGGILQKDMKFIPKLANISSANQAANYLRRNLLRYGRLLEKIESVNTEAMDEVVNQLGDTLLKDAFHIPREVFAAEFTPSRENLTRLRDALGQQAENIATRLHVITKKRGELSVERTLLDYSLQNVTDTGERGVVKTLRTRLGKFDKVIENYEYRIQTLQEMLQSVTELIVDIDNTIEKEDEFRKGPLSKFNDYLYKWGSIGDFYKGSWIGSQINRIRTNLKSTVSRINTLFNNFLADPLGIKDLTFRDIFGDIDYSKIFTPIRVSGLFDMGGIANVEREINERKEKINQLKQRREELSEGLLRSLLERREQLSTQLKIESSDLDLDFEFDPDLRTLAEEYFQAEKEVSKLGAKLNYERMRQSLIKFHEDSNRTRGLVEVSSYIDLHKLNQTLKVLEDYGLPTRHLQEKVDSILSAQADLEEQYNILDEIVSFFNVSEKTRDLISDEMLIEAERQYNEASKRANKLELEFRKEAKKRTGRDILLSQFRSITEMIRSQIKGKVFASEFISDLDETIRETQEELQTINYEIEEAEGEIKTFKNISVGSSQIFSPLKRMRRMLIDSLVNPVDLTNILDDVLPAPTEIESRVLGVDHVRITVRRRLRQLSNILNTILNPIKNLGLEVTLLIERSFDFVLRQAQGSILGVMGRRLTLSQGNIGQYLPPIMRYYLTDTGSEKLREFLSRVTEGIPIIGGFIGNIRVASEEAGGFGKLLLGTMEKLPFFGTLQVTLMSIIGLLAFFMSKWTSDMDRITKKLESYQKVVQGLETQEDILLKRKKTAKTPEESATYDKELSIIRAELETKYEKMAALNMKKFELRSQNPSYWPIFRKEQGPQWYGGLFENIFGWITPSKWASGENISRIMGYGPRNNRWLTPAREQMLTEAYAIEKQRKSSLSELEQTYLSRYQTIETQKKEGIITPEEAEKQFQQLFADYKDEKEKIDRTFDRKLAPIVGPKNVEATRKLYETEDKLRHEQTLLIDTLGELIKAILLLAQTILLPLRLFGLGPDVYTPSGGMDEYPYGTPDVSNSINSMTISMERTIQEIQKTRESIKKASEGILYTLYRINYGIDFIGGVISFLTSPSQWIKPSEYPNPFAESFDTWKIKNELGIQHRRPYYPMGSPEAIERKTLEKYKKHPETSPTTGKPLELMSDKEIHEYFQKLKEQKEKEERKQKARLLTINEKSSEIPDYGRTLQEGRGLGANIQVQNPQITPGNVMGSALGVLSSQASNLMGIPLPQPNTEGTITSVEGTTASTSGYMPEYSDITQQTSQELQQPTEPTTSEGNVQVTVPGTNIRVIPFPEVDNSGILDMVYRILDKTYTTIRGGFLGLITAITNLSKQKDESAEEKQLDSVKIEELIKESDKPLWKKGLDFVFGPPGMAIGLLDLFFRLSPTGPTSLPDAIRRTPNLISRGINRYIDEDMGNLEALREVYRWTNRNLDSMLIQPLNNTVFPELRNIITQAFRQIGIGFPFSVPTENLVNTRLNKLQNRAIDGINTFSTFLTERTGVDASFLNILGDMIRGETIDSLETIEQRVQNIKGIGPVTARNIVESGLTPKQLILGSRELLNERINWGSTRLEAREQFFAERRTYTRQYEFAEGLVNYLREISNVIYRESQRLYTNLQNSLTSYFRIDEARDILAGRTISEIIGIPAIQEDLNTTFQFIRTQIQEGIRRLLSVDYRGSLSRAYHFLGFEDLVNLINRGIGNLLNRIDFNLFDEVIVLFDRFNTQLRRLVPTLAQFLDLAAEEGGLYLLLKNEVRMFNEQLRVGITTFRNQVARFLHDRSLRRLYDEGEIEPLVRQLSSRYGVGIPEEIIIGGSIRELVASGMRSIFPEPEIIRNIITNEDLLIRRDSTTRTLNDRERESVIAYREFRRALFDLGNRLFAGSSRLTQAISRLTERIASWAQRNQIFDRIPLLNRLEAPITAAYYAFTDALRDNNATLFAAVKAGIIAGMRESQIGQAILNRIQQHGFWGEEGAIEAGLAWALQGTIGRLPGGQKVVDWLTRAGGRVSGGIGRAGQVIEGYGITRGGRLGSIFGRIGRVIQGVARRLGPLGTLAALAGLAVGGGYLLTRKKSGSTEDKIKALNEKQLQQLEKQTNLMEKYKYTKVIPLPGSFKDIAKKPEKIFGRAQRKYRQKEIVYNPQTDQYTIFYGKKPKNYQVPKNITQESAKTYEEPPEQQQEGEETQQSTTEDKTKVTFKSPLKIQKGYEGEISPGRTELIFPQLDPDLFLQKAKEMDSIVQDNYYEEPKESPLEKTMNLIGLGALAFTIFDLLKEGDEFLKRRGINIGANEKIAAIQTRIKDIFSPVLKKTEVNTNIGKVENILNNLKNIELLSIKNISESTKAFTIFAKIGDKISPYFKTLYSKLGPLGVITTLLTGIYIATSSTNDGTRGPGQPQKKSPLETALDVTFFGLFIKDLWTITGKILERFGYKLPSLWAILQRVLGKVGIDLPPVSILKSKILETIFGKGGPGKILRRIGSMKIPDILGKVGKGLPKGVPNFLRPFLTRVTQIFEPLLGVFSSFLTRLTPLLGRLTPLLSRIGAVIIPIATRIISALGPIGLLIGAAATILGGIFLFSNKKKKPPQEEPAPVSPVEGTQPTLDSSPMGIESSQAEPIGASSGLGLQKPRRRTRTRRDVLLEAMPFAKYLPEPIKKFLEAGIFIDGSDVRDNKVDEIIRKHILTQYIQKPDKTEADYYARDLWKTILFGPLIVLSTLPIFRAESPKNQKSKQETPKDKKEDNQNISLINTLGVLGSLGILGVILGNVGKIFNIIERNTPKANNSTLNNIGVLASTGILGLLVLNTPKMLKKIYRKPLFLRPEPKEEGGVLGGKMNSPLKIRKGFNGPISSHGTTELVFPQLDPDLFKKKAIETGREFAKNNNNTPQIIIQDGGIIINTDNPEVIKEKVIQALVDAARQIDMMRG